MNDVKELLELGAMWRFLSLLFRCPSDTPASSIVELESETPPEWRAKAQEIVAARECSQLEATYHSLLGSGGPVSPYESDYQGPGAEGLRDKGAVLGDVAGFYKAFAFDHQEEILETHDHISVELAFMSYLKLKEAYACMDEDESAYRICCEAEDKFWDEHLSRWTLQFVDSINLHGMSAVYEKSACLLRDFSSSRMLLSENAK